MSKVFNMDSANIDSILNNLSEQNRNDALFKAVSKGGEELVKETKDELLRLLPNASRGKRYEGKPMVKGVKMKKDKAYNEVKVHIMSDYRLKFFEMGTAERYLKKPLKNKERYKYKYKSQSKPYRGKIEPLKFFQKARENSNMIETVMKTLEKEINKLLK